MACQNESFENHVMCPICLDTYKNPMSLKCRHSMCKQCIDRLVKRSGDVVCPQCRILSRANDVVKDFQLKSLVDTYKAELPAPKYPCNICQAKAFVFYCQQCKILICNQCKVHHKNIPTCRDHYFSFDTYHKDYPLSSQFNVEGVENSGIGSDEALSHFTKCMTDMEKFALDQIEKAENDTIQQVKQHHSYLRHKVTAECRCQKNNYKRHRNALKSAANALKTRVKAMVTKLQIPILNMTAARVIEELEKADSVKKEVQKLQKDYSIDKLHISVAALIKESTCSPDNVQPHSKFTSVDFVPFKLCRNGVFIKNATEEWSNMSSHSGYQPGDRLLTPTRNRRARSGSDSPQRSSGSPQRGRSRSPLTNQQEPRSGPSQGATGQYWRFGSRVSGSRSPWSRSRSRTPIPRSRSQSYSPPRRDGANFRYNDEDEAFRSTLFNGYVESDSSYDGAGPDYYVY